jgi:protein involved in polysaccharide export with SLBB domain
MRRILCGFLIFLVFSGALYSDDLDEKIYPGNLISVSLFGNKIISKDYRIDPQGYITFPDAGQINTTGQTLSSLRELAIKKLATVYKNASTLTLTKKSNDIYVNVLGLVKSPGLYLFSPDASLQVVFQKAGGLGDGAQMNKIQLRHNGKVTEIDYRKYLEGGLDNKLPKLAAMDEIFVPSSNLISNISGPLAVKTDKGNSWVETPTDKSLKLIGAVGKPGRYVWSNDVNLLDLIAEAGGPTSLADTENISIITPATGKTGSRTIKFNLAQFIEKGGNITSIPSLGPGYTVNIPELQRDAWGSEKNTWTKTDPKTVIYVFGEVRKPGRYRFDNKLNFLDILSAADGPTEKADLHDVHLIDRQGVYPQVLHVNLSLYFETGDPELIPHILTGDAVYVPQIGRDYTEIKSRHVVKILGEVNKPGRYRFTSNMTILDLLSAAGGPTSQAWVKKILIVNIGPNLQTKTSVFDLMKFSRTGDLRMLPALREGDVVYIPNNMEDDKKRFAELLQNLANIVLIITSVRNGGI